MDFQIDYEKNGMMVINNELWLHEHKYLSIDQEEQVAINTFTLSFTNKKGSLIQTNEEDVDRLFKLGYKDIELLCKNHRLTFQHERSQIMANACKAFDVQTMGQILISGNAIFASLQPHEIDRLGNILWYAGKKSRSELIDLSIAFASAQRCANFRDFVSFFEFACAFVVERKESIESNYYEKWQQAKLDGRYKKEIDFKKSYKDEPNGILDGVIGNRGSFFYEKALNCVLDSHRRPRPEIIKELQVIFKDCKTRVKKENEEAKLPFRTHNLATYHYFKHKEFGDRALTVHEYFTEAMDLFASTKVKRANVMTQDGGSFLFNYLDANNGAFGVLISSRRPPFDKMQNILTFYQKRMHR